MRYGIVLSKLLVLRSKKIIICIVTRKKLDNNSLILSIPPSKSLQKHSNP